MRAAGDDPIGGLWSTDLAAPEWTAFTDAAAGRSLLLASLQDDTSIDSYRLMENAMTVFGFGRNNTTPLLTGQRQFVVRFLETTDTNVLRATAPGVAQPIVTTTAAGDERPAEG
ncbi:MAG: hypothetical protein R2705_10850 [Ilumatobacteraceae bacterium]